ncbi:MAG: HindIII family type II restriction endonuclease [Mesonia hippocampi]|uniref:HindIII family type II restriction endonuclease n=1 Tax=Mesonia hippocampi TaxID=1628250 RepID=UPI003F94AC37
MTKIISAEAITRRNIWVDKIDNISGNFASNSEIIEKELGKELSQNGISSLLDHLRLCGNIPESYHHDSSEEKQYSKYTDALLAFAYKSIGLKSLVITERADVADVEGFGKDFSFVADAKAFRLSRTAKNQKDFKVQAMDRWKHGKPYAMVVCPIYQLPSRNSQIYQQAITRNVCVFTYSHLSLLVRYANEVSQSKAENLLFDIFKTVPALNPSKSAVDYWLGVNKTILGSSKSIFELWQDEKIAATESIEIAKVEALKYLSSEREKIMRMSHEEALKELVKASKIESKIEIIKRISDNGLFGVK